MTTSGLPAWAEWLQALAVPAIALAGVIVAWSNFRLSKDKRRDDLFERRYALFLDAHRFQEFRERPAGGFIDDNKFYPDKLEGPAIKAEIVTRAGLLFDDRFAEKLTGLLEKPSCREACLEVDQELFDLFRKGMR